MTTGRTTTTLACLLFLTTSAVAEVPLTTQPASTQPLPHTAPTTAPVSMVVAIVRPQVVDPTPEDVARLRVPDGFRVDVFASGLLRPRMLAVADDGTVFVSRRQQGDVLALRDTNADGTADVVRSALKLPDAHGLNVHDGTLYVASINEVFSLPVLPDGSLGEPRKVLDNLPDAGQHPNRTLAVGPDGMLYVSVGSTCNACDERNIESATMLRANPDGTGRSIFAKGLRNTIGFDWHPGTKEMWGMDHGIDWLGDDYPPEELNRIVEAGDYGWPFFWGDNQINPADDPFDTRRVSYEEQKQKSTAPALTYTAHAAPMQMAFMHGDTLGADYRNSAFVAMHGSWNRTGFSGYEVVRIRFDDSGKPTGIESFMTGFVRATDGKVIGRPCGIAVAKDGSLLVSDDASGFIYRVSKGPRPTARISPK